MGVAAVIEPLVVVTLLFGGTWINRRSRRPSHLDQVSSKDYEPESPGSQQSYGSRSTSPDPENLANPPPMLSFFGQRRSRVISILGFSWKVETPCTKIFEERLLSRVLRKFPFLVECWYWALVYWTYQIGRAITAMTLKEETVDVARHHALQVIWLEEKLGLFVEVSLQGWLLKRPLLMACVNWIYSFIHIPGTIAFLVGLYYYTTTRNETTGYRPLKPWYAQERPAGPALYQDRRRTLAMCNFLAFIVFTLWPCMPPRLLSDASVETPDGEAGRKYGFVDTVHGADGVGSVWTQNRFCNQYAAMPSLHFGYSLLIGLSIMTIPLESPSHGRGGSKELPRRYTLWHWRRVLCVVLGFLYPFIILLAIITTANHFVLDAVAGMVVCGLGWWLNGALLNLLPLEDYFLWLLRIHKPESSTRGYSGMLS
ncbi:integral membrane protein [Penicillium chermesinum]|uniref:Integral membrane protein n=1 Tax=Penicillium chermesinum TaxID=63820 RepID=A0A9W9NZH9_9EURO|nr:uncharacterized protein N7468_005564 [Penicillium chermesinum]KAJ5232608.1 integral membrane protein [Penicillium chermesinum]